MQVGEGQGNRGYQQEVEQQGSQPVEKGGSWKGGEVSGGLGGRRRRFFCAGRLRGLAFRGGASRLGSRRRWRRSRRGKILPPQAGHQRGGGRSQAQKAHQGPGGEAGYRHHADQDDGRQSDSQRPGRLQTVVRRLLGHNPASDPASRGHAADEGGDQKCEPQEGHQSQSDHRNRQYERHRCDQKKRQKSRQPRGQGLPFQCVGTGAHRPVEHQVDEQVQEHENGHESPHPGKFGHDGASPEQSSSEPGSGVRHLVRQGKRSDRDQISSRGEPGRHLQSAAYGHQVSANHGSGLDLA